MWGLEKKNWLPILVQLAKWGLVQLTVVDRWREVPAELATLIQEGVLDYLGRPWGSKKRYFLGFFAHIRR